MHVCRGDVIQDTHHYYPVAFYVEMIPGNKLNDPNHYVFLLTNDSGAIKEVHEFFPNMEDHTLSGDPAFEIIAILSMFDLVQDCSTLVHGTSGFTEYIYQYVSNGGVDDFYIANANPTNMSFLLCF
jgi:hypothetical protein